MRSFGKSPTPRQALETATRRKNVATLLIKHKDEALRYIPPALIQSVAAPSVSDQGKPEHLKTLLPSRLPGVASAQALFLASASSEKALRRVACLKALQSVRALTVQKTHLLKGKEQHIRGIVRTTRAEGLIKRLGDKVKHARWEYTSSRSQLIKMGLSEQDSRTFRPLTDKDMTGLTAALKGKDILGDGYAKMPWYWRVSLSVSAEDSEHISTSGADIRKEYEESK